ncbi:ty3-gypsy retrotransposon protein [Tanacetum coccineum]
MLKNTCVNGDPEVLVKWEKHNLEEASWENLNSLRLQFPDLDYIGDNVNYDGEGDDTAQRDQSLGPQHQATQIQTRPARESMMIFLTQTDKIAVSNVAKQSTLQAALAIYFSGDEIPSEAAATSLGKS